ncbi:TIGR00725 family protein [Desulfocurvus sp. DL9XJH121]
MAEIRISVIGSGRCGQETQALARELGAGIAARGWTLVCGGKEGVMRAAAQGAVENGGKTVGILPGLDPRDANPYIQTAVATGLGQMRNMLVIANGDVAVAVEGGAGTLSEIGHALKHGRKVVALGAWKDLPGVIPADGPGEALDLAARILAEQPPRGGHEER